MLKLNVIIFTLSCLISVSVGQIVQAGQCDPNIQLVNNFDINGFLGTWHQIFSYYNESPTGTCVKSEFSFVDGRVTVLNTEVINQALSTVSGSVTINGNDGSGKPILTLDAAPNVQRTKDLWILATDYISFAVTYSCINISSNEKLLYSSILSRTHQLSPTSLVKVDQVIESITELSYDYYLATNQSTEGCLHFAETKENEPVQFRGQCDNNIPVMTHFHPGSFMGLWHTVEMYPTSSQTGSCINSLYMIRDGVIEVLNTQVINKWLDATEGIATIASVDGSAKIALILPIAGTNATETIDYWILDTDYVSYALVYSCSNINSEIMQVTSWKLSRTKRLTDYANWVINQIVSNINVLDQQYFQVVDQSASGCFYFPVPESGVPVVFPGQCDDTIGMQNLDFERFQGTWYEIESYPKEKQVGQCISHTFTAASNTQMNLVSSSVTNQSLFTNNAEISTGSNGILIMTITDNGQSISVPLSIIDTDYSTYALAYTCVQIEHSDFRTVWSWQLSRWRGGLSAAAKTAINNAIVNIDVLDHRYYEFIDQSDEACFVFPDVRPGEPVIFPGSCDDNVRPLANLNVAWLLGRWMLIESYDVYKGTCNEITFSMAADGTGVVTVTQVVNQRLEIITGSATFYPSGILGVEFPTGTKAFWILDTDYESYALVYSCENISSDQRRVSSWKMSRTKFLSMASYAAMDYVINSINVLDNRYYVYKDHSVDGCFYYPEPDFDAPGVIFPGQCDSSVFAVSNFMLEFYMGLWYTIESYPAPFQDGGCNKAEYVLNNNGSVVIKKSQVVNQQLETWVGSAVVTSHDATAKLNVTFNVSGVDVTMNYWVISTDYMSFALVYSCQNLDAETKAVSSWKLSRTKTLTTTANAAINAVINSVQDLDQQYYIAMSHTEEDCFYYDEDDVDDDGVLLLGQCLDDSLVTAVHYFNPTLFAGTWYEVARYPSGIQKGECDSSDFILSGSNEFTVTHTSLNNETQSNTVTQATASNGGRGIISASIGGVPFNKIFILATDYRDYALAYTCRNVNQHSKQIYSWKLSRSRSGLSDFANTVIDHVVSNDKDLYEAYYQTTLQDDDTCPHYSLDDDNGDGDDQVPPSIEFPGPCREIRGMPNFNALAYLGKWYETARYSTPFQVGQCGRVEYSLSQQLIVSKTEVVRQTLRNQTGVVGLSNDGSGFMNLVFNDNGEIRTAQHYILATDYTSYSLVYSCTNLDNGNSRVSSWKLSRTPTLSPEASADMSNVIAETWALSEIYYQPTSQSDEDCFYVPA